MALALPWWDFRVLFPSHCHPPSLRIPLDTDILIAHGPAKNCADGNKGCPALLKARAACQSQSCVMLCFFFRFEAQKKKQSGPVQMRDMTYDLMTLKWEEDYHSKVKRSNKMYLTNNKCILLQSTACPCSQSRWRYLSSRFSHVLATSHAWMMNLLPEGGSTMPTWSGHLWPCAFRTRCPGEGKESSMGQPSSISCQLEKSGWS